MLEAARRMDVKRYLYTSTYGVYGKGDVMKDFTLLSNKGFKAYIRDSVIDDKVVYTLNIGPNINEETVKSIKKEVQALLNVSPEVQYYRD